MPRQFKAARKLNHLKVTEAARQLEVSQPTLSAWEGERKSPSIDNLEKMAELYHVSTDFLLGRAEISQPDALTPISGRLLPILNGKPVWTERCGWALVQADGQGLLLPSGNRIPFADAGDVYMKPPQYAEANVPTAEPLERDDLTLGREIWLEPISQDADLRQELRGYYRVMQRMAENAAGNRFLLDNYGVKWLAFKPCESKRADPL